VSTTSSLNATPVELDGDAQPPIPSGSTAWSVAASAMIGGFTFGILPALAWPQKFCDIAERESDRLRAPIRWASGIDNTKKTIDALNEARSRTRPRVFLSVLCYALVFYIVAAIWMEFRRQPFSLDRLIEYTYGYAKYARHVAWISGDAYGSPFDPTHGIHTLWCLTLSLAYGAQWLQVRLHRRSVGRFVKLFNRIVEPRGIQPVQMRESGGFRPLTVVGAVVFGALGAWWGIPMLLAASAQSRYTLLTRRSLALQFANRMSKSGEQRTFERRCATQGCGAVLPQPAKFCPQCGGRVPKPMLDQVG